MVNVNDVKNGMTIEVDGNIFTVLEFQHVKPGKGAAIVKMKLKNCKKISIMILAAFILVVVSTLIYFNSTSQKEENIIDKAKKTSGKVADNIPQKLDIIEIAKDSGKAISDILGKKELNDKEETK